MGKANGFTLSAAGIQGNLSILDRQKIIVENSPERSRALELGVQLEKMDLEWKMARSYAEIMTYFAWLQLRNTGSRVDTRG